MEIHKLDKKKKKNQKEIKPYVRINLNLSDGLTDQGKPITEGYIG